MEPESSLPYSQAPATYIAIETQRFYTILKMVKHSKFKCERWEVQKTEKLCKQQGTASRDTWLQQAIRETYS